MYLHKEVLVNVVKPYEIRSIDVSSDAISSGKISAAVCGTILYQRQNRTFDF